MDKPIKKEEAKGKAAKPHQPTWFDKMEDVLQWKVEAPVLNNPYEIPLSDKMIRDLTTSEVARRKVCSLRCLCDGYEVLLVKNIQSPQIQTSHPCVSAIAKTDILFTIQQDHVQTAIKNALEELRMEAVEELSRRKANTAQKVQQPSGEHKKFEPKKEETLQKTGETSFRVVRG